MIVYGRNLADLFTQAAWAMFDLMSDATTIRPLQSITVEVEAIDLEDLMVRWLSELLYRYDIERFVKVEPPRVVYDSFREFFCLDFGHSWKPTKSRCYKSLILGGINFAKKIIHYPAQRCRHCQGGGDHQPTGHSQAA